MVHKHMFPSQILVSEEVAEFIGAFIGDGNLYQHPRTGQLTFTGDPQLDFEYYAGRLLPIGMRYFGMQPILNTKNNCLQCKYYSQRLLDIFESQFGFTAGPKTFTARIPEVIIQSSLQIRCACLRGLFDTDGGVGFDKRPAYRSPYVRVNFVTSSCILVEQVAKILAECEIPHSIHSRNNTRQFQFQINGIDSVQAYLRTIGFSNPRHRNKLKQCGLLTE